MAAGLAAVALIAAACGPSTKTTSASGVDVSGGTQFVAESPIASALPAVNVLDLATGEPVNLAEAASGEKTTLVWLWAPH